MRRLGTKMVRAVAVAGLLSGLIASPALADHDKHHGNKHHGNDWHHGRHHDHHSDGYHSRTYSHRDYDRGYYYSEPRVDYYAAPRVYVPVPPPPSFGLNLVFPIH